MKSKDVQGNLIVMRTGKTLIVLTLAVGAGVDTYGMPSGRKLADSALTKVINGG